MAPGNALAAPRPATGRPTVCTPGVIAGMAKVVGSGGYPTVALETMGIDGTNHPVWLHYAQRDYDAGLEDSIFIKYSAEFLKAQAASEARLISRVHAAADAGPQYWPAAMTALERRHPDRWGKRERQEAPQHATQVQIAFVLADGSSVGLPAPQVRVLDVPARGADGPEPTDSDTTDLAASPLRICESNDTGGE